MEFTLDARKVRNFFLFIIILLTLAHIFRTLSLWWFHRDFPLFNLDEESNLPTFYSAVQLLLCSCLQFFIAIQRQRRNLSFVSHWTFLAFLFLYLSLDEAAKIHERIQFLLSSTIGNFWWIIGVLVGICLILAYRRFLMHIPATIRKWFVISAVVFVSGAIAMDYVTDHLRSALALALLLPVEEVLEMLGVLLFLYSLLLYLKSEGGEILIKL